MDINPAFNLSKLPCHDKKVPFWSYFLNHHKCSTNASSQLVCEETYACTSCKCSTNMHPVCGCLCISTVCDYKSHWWRGSCKDRLQRAPPHALYLGFGVWASRHAFPPRLGLRSSKRPSCLSVLLENFSELAALGRALFRLESRREETDLKRGSPRRGEENAENTVPQECNGDGCVSRSTSLITYTPAPEYVTE